MRKFALQKIDLEIIGEKFTFYKLVIDGKCKYDDFFNENKKDLLCKSQFIQIQTRIITIAEGNQHLLPPTKFKLLKRDKSDKLVDYEIKTKHLRVYFFKDKSNRIIVLGGKKVNQPKDLKRFRAIKKEYFKTQNNKYV